MKNYFILVVKDKEGGSPYFSSCLYLASDLQANMIHFDSLNCDVIDVIPVPFDPSSYK